MSGSVFLLCCLLVFFFKQKTAYEMRISDWSSDVCSSDLRIGTIAAIDVVPTVADRILDRVVAGAAVDRVVAEAADQRIVPLAADQRVVTGQARQDIAAAVAGKNIVQRVSGAVQVVEDLIADRKSKRLNSSH